MGREGFVEHAKRLLFCLGVVVLQLTVLIPIVRAGDTESVIALSLMENDRMKHEQAEEVPPSAWCQPRVLGKSLSNTNQAPLVPKKPFAQPSSALINTVVVTSSTPVSIPQSVEISQRCSGLDGNSAMVRE